MVTQPLPSERRFASLVQTLKAFVTSETFAYTIKRLLQGLLTLFLVSVFSFTLLQFSPGDYLSSLTNNPAITPGRIDALRRQFGLDKPPYIQYFFWLKEVLLHGNFGESFLYQRSISSLIIERSFATLLLAIASIFITWSIAIPLGIIGAVSQNQIWDRVLQVVSYLGQGFPSFITALLFLLLAQSSPLFPVGNMTSINHADFSPVVKVLDIGWHMILPLMALSVTSFAGLQRITRGNLLDVLRQNYVQTARAKGLPENRVIYIHALRNAINPLITILGFEFASLLSGAFITEYFFNWPGLGRLTLQALRLEDNNLVMASLLMGACMLILGNLLADLLLKVVDPRIQLSDNQR